MKMQADGTIVLPEEVRSRTGWEEGTELGARYDGRTLSLRPPWRRMSREEAERRVASVTGIIKSDKTTDEIMRELRGCR